MSARRAAVLCTAVLALTASGCVGPGKFVWADSYDGSAESPDAYALGAGDVVSVTVLNQPAASAARLKVRADGKITLPFLGDVEVADQTPAQVTQLLTERFKEFVQSPVVSVNVDEPRPFTIAVLGEVQRPGNYVLEARSGVLQALASAGGLTQYAHDDGVYVLRKKDADSVPVRIRFSYRALSRIEGAAGTFRLRPRDVVVVE